MTGPERPSDPPVLVALPGLPVGLSAMMLMMTSHGSRRTLTVLVTSFLRQQARIEHTGAEPNPAQGFPLGRGSVPGSGWLSWLSCGWKRSDGPALDRRQRHRVGGRCQRRAEDLELADLLALTRRNAASCGRAATV